MTLPEGRSAGLVSVIVPVHNRPMLVEEAVASAIAQSYRPIEIIVVDDGSTDDTPAVLAELAERHSEVRVIRRENGGPGLAREAGRLEARGEFIQYLDSDDRLLPAKFEVQVAALARHPECDVAYGWTRLINESGEVLEAPYKWTDRGLDALFPGLLVDRWWNTHTPLYRRSICDSVGPWSDMRMSEDWEYEARVGALGVRLAYIPEYLSDTRRHSADRLSGGAMTPEIVGDLVRLVRVLNRCARSAGVDLAGPEMAHFSRWSFSLARTAGAMGLPEVAEAAIRVAEGAGPAGRALDVRMSRLLARWVGWRTIGRLAQLMDRLRARPVGRRTLPLATRARGDRVSRGDRVL